MADNSNSQIPFPELAFIPEQLIPAGLAVEIPFYEFAKLEEGQNLEFSIKDFPEGFTIDPKTGILKGIAPKTELNQSFLVSLRLTNLDTGKYAESLFRLEVIGSLLLETEEGKAFFTQKPITFWEALKSWELRLFIQQLINEHFACVIIYDAKHPHTERLGKLINKREASTGWTIFNYENVVMIAPGDKAFEQYGNRGRLLNTLREAYQQDVVPKHWEQVMLEGSDVENVGKAWVIAKELNIPVVSNAPSEVAEINLYNLNRIYAGQTPSKRQIQPRV